MSNPPDASTDSLLLEIGTEELPPHSLPKLGEALGRDLCAALHEAALLDKAKADHEWFAAPRRLAVLIPQVHRWQPEQRTMRRGPSVEAAFDGDGKPTKAATGFARSCGVTVDALETVDHYLVFRRVKRGLAGALVPGCVERALRGLPAPRRMRWGEGDEEFVRPVHWVVLMHGSDIIPGKILSVSCGNQSRGHRFHHNRFITIDHADHYAALLKEQGRVIAGFALRRKHIATQLQALAKEHGAVIRADDALLDEVTGLVEWPVALAGEFDASFMKLPEEVLVSSMQKHQRYFPMRNRSRRLLPRFVVVGNIDSSDPEQVRQGNQRVLGARLADARFFWDSDRKTPLADHAKRLERVLFHKQLGSVADKTTRIAALGEALAAELKADRGDPQTVRNAAALAKADLVTDMVGEFPELQGTMGRHYALADGARPEVALAIEEHYLPRFADDRLPQSRPGQVLALADRIDTLVGIFAAGEKPKGDKDPYGLRRAALGVLHILIEKELNLDLMPWLHAAARHHAVDDPDLIAETVLTFILERLRTYYGERGFQAEDFLAVYSLRPPNPLDFDRRIKAVAEFRKLDAAAALAAANKRIANILEQADGHGAVPVEVDERLYEEAAERALGKAVRKLSKELHKDLEARRYSAALKRLAALHTPVDDFFDQVMVMCENPKVRNNRQALLRTVRDLFNRIADISRLAIR